MMKWRDIALALGLSRENVRQIALRGLEKLRRKHPDLVLVLAATVERHDQRSPAAMMIDAAPYADMDVDGPQLRAAWKRLRNAVRAK